jgi:transposase
MISNMARRLSAVRTSSGTLRLNEGEAVHIGLDLHKATYHVSVSSAQRGLISTWVQPASPGALIERLRPILGQVAEVVYEVGPTGFSPALRLRAAGFTAQVIATSKVPIPACPEAKCDRFDCRRLALLAFKGMLHPVRVPTELEEADRQILRLRELLIRKTRSIQQQIKALLQQHGIPEPDGLAHWSERAVEALRQLELLPELRFCLDVMLDELEHAGRQVKRATRCLEELSQTERHNVASGAMRSVPGVGLVTAMTFRLVLPEPERVDDAGQIAKMAGLAPMVRQSGETRREGVLIRSSSARLRTALVEVVWRWVACDEAARAVYRRLVANTGRGKKAIVGVARRLGMLLWRLSCCGQPYRAAA